MNFFTLRDKIKELHRTENEDLRYFITDLKRIDRNPAAKYCFFEDINKGLTGEPKKIRKYLELFEVPVYNVRIKKKRTKRVYKYKDVLVFVGKYNEEF